MMKRQYRRFLWLILAAGACIALAVFVFLEHQTLSPIEQEAHAVFAHRLNQVFRGENSPPLILCIYIEAERQPLAVSAALLKTLDRSTPKKLNFEFVDGSTCHFDDAGVT